MRAGEWECEESGMEVEQRRCVVYDDLADVLACGGGRHFDQAAWDDVVDRLAVYDVTHLAGGSSAYGWVAAGRGPVGDDLDRLIRELARASEPRLRDALIALLLRHPEDAPALRRVMETLPAEHPARASLLARLLAAAALQREHYAAWARALPGRPLIDVADLVASEGLPAPEVDDGRALLRGAQGLVSGQHPWVDYVDGWEDVARHALRELEGGGSYTRVVAER